MIFYARIAGVLLLLVFGSMDGLLELRKRNIESLRWHLKHEGRSTFARITDLQETRSRGQVHYYLSVTGRLGELRFESVHEVPRQIFHVHTRGSNIEMLVYSVANRKAIIHVRDNPIPYGDTLPTLHLIARALNLLGVFLTLLGFIIGPVINMIAPGSPLGTNRRPTIEPESKTQK